jgi:hypothetical protein
MRRLLSFLIKATTSVVLLYLSLRSRSRRPLLSDRDLASNHLGVAGRQNMRIRKSQLIQRILITIVLFALMLVKPSDAAVRIQDDMGGSLGDYILMFSKVRRSGELVIIDGRCYSACTIVTGSVPRRNICVTPRATLGFHAALAPDQWGSLVINRAATHALYNLYPTNIKIWLNHHGGLGRSPIVLGGSELSRMYRACPQNADPRF